MGRDKATVEVCDKTLIQHVYERVYHVFGNIIVVSSNHEQFRGIDAPIVRDICPIRSSIVGIASALLSANTEHVFVLACDMPFVTAQSIQHVLQEVRGEDIVIPRTRYGYEALHAVYRRTCLSIILTRIGFQRLKVTDLFPFLSVKIVEEHPAFDNGGVSVFTNINVEQDLSLLDGLARK